VANGHGGRRQGAGRKPNAQRYAAVRQSVSDAIAARLHDRVAALELLAEGGYEQIEEELVPAGLVFIDDITVEDGKVVRKRIRAFPNLPEKELVCIRRKRSFAAPDRAANIYLIDRILGKPGTETDEDGGLGDEDTAPTIDELLELWNQSSDTSSDT